MKIKCTFELHNFHCLSCSKDTHILLNTKYTARVLQQNRTDSKGLIREGGGEEYPEVSLSDAVYLYVTAVWSV